jgi:outer membrane protein insertion porin family
MFTRTGGRAVALVAVLAAASAAPVAAQSPVDEESPRIERLRFEGADALEERELRRSIVTEATRCRSVLLRPFCWVTDWDVFVRKEYLDREVLARDDLRLRVRYFRRGYREAGVGTELRPRGRGVEVVFRIAEGEPTVIDTLHLEQAAEVLGERQLRRARLPRQDAPLDLVRLDSARARLREMLEDRGYLDAVIRDTIEVAEGARSARVEIVLEPGLRATLERFEIEGNELVSDGTISDATILKRGSVLRRSDVVAAQRSLYESNLFHEASVEVPEQADSAKTLRIEVREAPLRSARLEGGFNTVDFFQTEGRFVHYNFFGGGRRLDTRVTLGNLLAGQLNGRGIFRDVMPGEVVFVEEAAFLRPNWQASAEFTQPAFRGAANTVGLGGFAHRRTIPAVAVDRGAGASLSFTRRLRDRSPASLTYRFESTSVEAGDVYFCVNFGICDPPTIGALRAPHNLSPLAASYITDHSDDPLSPREGWRTRLDLEHASDLTASDFHYHRASGSAARYLSSDLGRRVWAGRIRFGWIRPLGSTARAMGLDVDGSELLHPRKRFYAGGSQSVRGYGENQLGPRILTVSPEALMDEELQNPCAPEEIAAGTCDPGVAPTDAFLPRPLGGNSVLQANLEYRFPFWRQIGAAVFVDGAVVRGRGAGLAAQTVGAMTPGFGARYESPFGPIRVDLGIRPTITEELPVVTEFVDEEGLRRLVRLDQRRHYDPLDVEGGLLRQVLARLTLHLSIGQAF